jgi:hypothetical protein
MEIIIDIDNKIWVEKMKREYGVSDKHFQDILNPRRNNND